MAFFYKEVFLLEYFDVSIIPSFDNLCERLYLTQRGMLEQELVNRIGPIRLQVYDASDMLSPLAHHENVGEHVFHCINIAVLCDKFFGAYLCEQYLPENCYSLARTVSVLDFHDYAEIITGDSPDNGSRNEDSKNSTELCNLRKLLCFLPEKAKNSILHSMEAFQKCDTYEYCIDKLSFIYRLAWYKYHGLEGSMVAMQEAGWMSPEDEKRFSITRSDRPIDNIALHFCGQTEQNFFRPLFMGLIRAAYSIEYGRTSLPSFLH